MVSIPGNMGKVLPEYLSKWTTKKVENGMYLFFLTKNSCTIHFKFENKIFSMSTR